MAPESEFSQMIEDVDGLHPCPVGGVNYVFRTPSVYDEAKMRRLLARQKVRRPSIIEMRVAAQAGVAAMALATGEPEEGERQKLLIERWYELLNATDENDIDEPDFEARAAELAAREAERKAELAKIYPQIAAIEANLERHSQTYADLIADRGYWDDVSRIDVVRLLLVKSGGGDVPLRDLRRDDDFLVDQAEYRRIPKSHRMALATFAFGLMSVEETALKN
jgi:hypothetical protein